MKRFRSVVASMAVVAASASTQCYAHAAAPQTPRTDPSECTASADPSRAPKGSGTQPPVLSIGVSDPDTKLNLPWFLTDIVHAVNTHQSARCFFRALKSGI